MSDPLVCIGQIRRLNRANPVVVGGHGAKIGE